MSLMIQNLMTMMLAI
jgi:hypothetical protein